MNESSYQQRPTKRAADGGESARFMNIFLALSVFPLSDIFYPRPPSAANAIRWADPLPARKVENGYKRTTKK